MVATGFLRDEECFPKEVDVGDLQDALGGPGLLRVVELLASDQLWMRTYSERELPAPRVLQTIQQQQHTEKINIVVLGNFNNIMTILYYIVLQYLFFFFTLSMIKVTIYVYEVL